MVRGRDQADPSARTRTFGALRLLGPLCLALAWGPAFARSYPPMGPYGAPAQGPYQGWPQGPQQGAPQAPFQGAPPPGAYQTPYQSPYQTPYPGGTQGGYPQAYPQGPYQAPPAGGYQQPYRGMPYQFRPTEPSRGAPPAYQPPASQMPGYQPPFQGAWPGGTNGYAQPQPAARQSKPPRLEWSLDETQPYVQQNLVLRLRLISPESLSTADPELTADGDALIQKLSGPSSTTRSTGGGNGAREVVTEFVLSLSPLRTGPLELPAPKVVGTRPGPYGASERYEAVASKPIRLQVRPAMASVRPWLPLHSLTLNASFDHGDEVRPGQPVTLALELTGVGAHATELPNLEDELASPDFRIYREQTLTDTNLTGDGRNIVGKRTEYYTLVPQSSGTLRLPEIEVPWWNVETGARQVATLPIRTLQIAGGGPFRLAASLTASEGGWGKVWMPLGAVLLVLGGYWAGVIFRGGPSGETGRVLLERLRGGAAQAARFAGERTRRVLQRLHPAPMAATARDLALTLLPESSRLLMVVRQANQSREPADWCARFEQGARRHLRACSTGSFPNMTDRILALRPRADRAKLTRLMEQLDSALYGRQDIDFPRWKRDFMHQIGRAPALLRPRRAEHRIRRAHLPALNPGTA